MPKKVIICSNLRKLCRICLDNKRQLHNLFNQFKNYSLAHHISSVADLKISEEDLLPKSICQACVAEVKNIVKFIEKCKKSEKYLLSLINKSSNVKIDTENKKIKREPKNTYCEVTKGIPEINNQGIHCFLLKEEKPDIFSENSDDGHIGLSHYDYYSDPKDPSLSDSYNLDCSECGKTFINKIKKKMHWYNVHRKNSFKCEKCSRIFKSSMAYEKHISNEVNCKDKYKGIRIEGHGKMRMYHCIKCDHKTSSVSDLRKHLVRHSGARPYACNLCTKTYTSHKSLSYHKESIHHLFKVEITCHLCGKVIQGRHKFNRHFRYSHPNNHYQCDICKAFIKSKWGLICHIKTHDNLKEYVCENCGKTFNTGFNLRNHIRRVHENIKDPKHSCHLCEYKTKGVKFLQDHLQQHSQEKLQCTVCFRFVDTPLKLLKHMKVHGEKKHFCLYCNKGFATKKQCTEHVRWVHSKQTKIKCYPEKPIMRNKL